MDHRKSLSYYIKTEMDQEVNRFIDVLRENNILGIVFCSEGGSDSGYVNYAGLVNENGLIEVPIYKWDGKTKNMSNGNEFYYREIEVLSIKKMYVAFPEPYKTLVDSFDFSPYKENTDVYSLMYRLADKFFVSHSPYYGTGSMVEDVFSVKLDDIKNIIKYPGKNIDNAVNVLMKPEYSSEVKII